MRKDLDLAKQKLVLIGSLSNEASIILLDILFLRFINTYCLSVLFAYFANLTISFLPVIARGFKRETGRRTEGCQEEKRDPSKFRCSVSE